MKRCLALLAWMVVTSDQGDARLASSQAPLPVPLMVNEKSDRRLLEPLLKSIGDAAGIQWVTQYLPLRRLLVMAEQGQAFSFGVLKTAQREQIFSFSDPVFFGYVWLIKRRSTLLDFSTLEDLKGRSVCTFQGSHLSPSFDAAKDVLFEGVAVGGGLDRGVAMLRAERCDALAISTHLGPNPKSLEDRIRADAPGTPDLVVLAQPVAAVPVFLAVRKGDELAALLPRINQALRAQRQTIDKLVLQQ